MSDVSKGMKKQFFPNPVPKYTEDRQILRGKLSCPHCGQKIKVRTFLSSH